MARPGADAAAARLGRCAPRPSRRVAAGGVISRPFGEFPFAPRLARCFLCAVMDATKVLGKTLVTSPERRHEADADIDIVHRVQAGDVAAFDRLILKYRERVYGIVYNMTSNREDTADLTQDAFIKAFQSIHRFGGQSSFFTWLYRIAVNSTLSHLRKARLRSFFSLERIDSDEPVSKEIIAALTDKSGAEKNTYVRELQEKLND